MATTHPHKLRKLAAALGVGSLLVVGTAACDDAQDTTEPPVEQPAPPAPPAPDGGLDDGTGGRMDDGTGGGMDDGTGGGMEGDMGGDED